MMAASCRKDCVGTPAETTFWIGKRSHDSSIAERLALAGCEEQIVVHRLHSDCLPIRGACAGGWRRPECIAASLREWQQRRQSHSSYELAIGRRGGEFQRHCKWGLPLHYRFDYLPAAGADCAGARAHPARTGRSGKDPALHILCRDTDGDFAGSGANQHLQSGNRHRR